MPITARFGAVASLSIAILSFALSSCAWSGGESDDEGACNPDCLARCRAECTNSVDAEGYDECSEGCTCGCD